MTTAVPSKQAGMTVTSSTLPVRARQGSYPRIVYRNDLLTPASFCTMLPTASSKSRPSATFQEPHVLSSTSGAFAIVAAVDMTIMHVRQSIYVTSYHKHAVYRFNARTGAPQGKFTHGGPTLFRPMDLEFDPFGVEGLGGNLYVARYTSIVHTIFMTCHCSQTSVYQFERHSGAFINQW